MNANLFITLIINVVINMFCKKNALQNLSSQEIKVQNFKNMDTSSEYAIN